MNRGAFFDREPSPQYRYHLWREWGDPSRRATFCMLNASTANGEEDDPTIRRCIGFARQWGCGALDAVNLYALVSPDPKVLLTHPDPVGPLNDWTIGRVVADPRCAIIVVAWGAFPAARKRERAVLELLRSSQQILCRQDLPVECLGHTKAGAPRHPLYLRRDVERVPFCEKQ